VNRFQAIDPALLRLQPGHRVLDVGCGVGRSLLELSHERGYYIGVDWDRDDLRRGAYWYHQMRIEGKAQGVVRFVHADITRLPFNGESFDRVICTEVLEHVPEDGAVLGEMIRVLRPGGVLAVAVPDEVPERLLWKLAPHYQAVPGGHIRIYGRQAIRDLLTNGGLPPFAVRFRHSLESIYWLFGAIAPGRGFAEPHPLVDKLREALSTDHDGFAAILDACDRVGNFLLPKSIVLYARKPV
jgi:ubiquinone/menaquinone biosynthesis C-methylase UbiE